MLSSTKTCFFCKKEQSRCDDFPEEQRPLVNGCCSLCLGNWNSVSAKLDDKTNEDAKGEVRSGQNESDSRLFASTSGHWEKCLVTGAEAPAPGGVMMTPIKIGLDDDFPEDCFVASCDLIPFDAAKEGKDHDQDPDSESVSAICPQCQEDFQPIPCPKNPDKLTEYCQTCKPVEPEPKIDDVSDETDKSVRTIATDSAQQQITKQLIKRVDDLEVRNKQLVAESKTSNSDMLTDTSYSQLVFYEGMMGPFKHPFPKKMNEMFQWIHQIRNYQTKMPGMTIPAAFFFIKIMQSVKGDVESDWRNHREKKFREFVGTNPVEAAKPDAQKNFNAKLETVEELIKFTIERMPGQCDVGFFKRRLDQVKCFKDESPKETLNRVEQYLFQYETIRNQINPVLKDCKQIPLRTFTNLELLGLYKRVFMEDNDMNTYLSNKVLSRVITKWKYLSTKYLADAQTEKEYGKFLVDFKKYIKDKLTDSVLSTYDEESREEGRKWKAYHEHLSLFALSPDGNRKRKYPESGSDSNSRSKPKKRKFDRNNPCSFGADCRFLRLEKSCKFYHPPNEVKLARMNKKVGPRKSPRKTPPKRPSRARTGAKSGRIEACRNRADGRACAKTPCPFWPCCNQTGGPRAQSSGPRSCSFGKSCKYWQLGTCRKSHNAAEMTCGTCGKSGHSSSSCRNGNKGPSRYNPGKNPNHQGAKKHFTMTVDDVKECIQTAVKEDRIEQKQILNDFKDSVMDQISMSMKIEKADGNLNDKQKLRRLKRLFYTNKI